jgi:stringent starvation protein B
MDAGLTPQILVNAALAGVDVPREFVQDGAIVLNVHDRAVKDLQMSNESVSFSARFAGQARGIFVPVEAVLAIYARENGQGLFFEIPSEHEQSDKPSNSGDGSKPAAEPNDRRAPERGKPNLKLV